MTDDGRRRRWKRTKCLRYNLQARPAFRHPGYRAVREELNAAPKARGYFGIRRGADGGEQGPRMKRSRIQQLELRTRCVRRRELGQKARECPEGNRGQRNDERYDRRAGTAYKFSSSWQGRLDEDLFSRSGLDLGATWTSVALGPDEVVWDTGAQEGLIGQ